MTHPRPFRPDPAALHQQVLEAYEALGYPHDVVGSWAISDNDVADFVEIVAEQKPRNILEVGTFVGVSTLLMALAAPAARIFTVDPDFPLEVEMGALNSDLKDVDPTITTQELGKLAAEKLGVQERIEFVRGGFAVTSTFASAVQVGGATTELVGPALCEREGPFDLIFVDGLHTAEAVAADLALAAKHLMPTGAIVLHDCIGFWGANVRAGIFEFLRTHHDYRFTHPRYSDLYKSVGFIRPRALPRSKRERTRESLAKAGAGEPARNLMRTAINAAVRGAAFELWVTAPLVSGGKGAEKSAADGVRVALDSAANSQESYEAATAKLRKRPAPALFSADLLDFASDEALAKAFAFAQAEKLPLICAFTPPGEIGITGPASRPLAAIVDLAEAAGMHVFTLPALQEEPLRYEMLPRTPELGLSSLFAATLLFTDQAEFTSAGGEQYVRLTPALAREREQLVLQRVHLAASFRNALGQMRSASDLAARFEARKEEVEQKALSDASENAQTIQHLSEQVAETHKRFQAASHDIQSYVSEKLALETATTRLMVEAEALRCSHQALRERYEALSADLASATQREAELRQHVAQTQAELMRLQDVSEQRATEVATLSSELEAAKKALYDQRAAADEQFFALVETYSTLDGIAAAFDVARAEAAPAGEGAPTLTVSLSALQQRAFALAEEHKALQAEIAGLHASTSWRITSPLRSAVVRLRALRRP